MSRIITPGGRVGDDASSNDSPRENWVERAGGLPRYIRIVRNGLMKDGMSEGRATALAIAAITRWAAGGDNVTPKVQAAAEAALAQWEAMKKKAGEKGLAYDEVELKGEHDLIFYSQRSTPQVVKRGEPGKPKDGYGNVTKRRKATEEEERVIARGDWLQVDEHGNKPSSDKYKKTKYRPALVKKHDGSLYTALDDVSESEFKSAVGPTLLSELHDLCDMPTTETKEATMEMEFKAVGVSGMTVESAKDGIVTTIVSVTGVKDNVRDVIHPGAYEKSLATRTPKGVWSHAWDTPVSKTLAVKELMPGDALLPKSLPNGEPFPAGAGALLVKTQFNLDTQRGREAYSDVVFFGDQQEWSIGYQVPPGAARVDSKTGIRHIDYLELYEYSPVLFGAMSAARTVSDPARDGAGVKADELSFMEFPDVRSAQMAYKSISMSATEFKDWASSMDAKREETDEEKGLGICKCGDADCDHKCAVASGKKPEVKGGDEEEADHDESDEDEDFDEEEKALFIVDNLPTAYEYEYLVKSYEAIGAVLADYEQHVATQTKGLSEIVSTLGDVLVAHAEELKDAAEAFDMAYKDQDIDGLNEYGDIILNLVEKGMDGADEETKAAMRKVAAGVASMAPEEVEDTEVDDEVQEEEVQDKPLPPRTDKKEAETVQIETKELDAMRVAFADMLKK